MTTEAEILTSVTEGVGVITLNRPQRINCLTIGMMHALADVLTDWAADQTVARVELRGAGERGLCAGADVRLLRDQVLAGQPDLVLDFLLTEYDVDELIWRYPKPFTSYLAGISMGGGLGLAQHASRRIGQLATRWAMPETAIGLWPDVGVCFELSRAPGEAGTYLAMTGESVDGASALWAGFLDQADGVDEDSAQVSWLAANRGWIDECFSGDSAEAIYQRLLVTDHPEAQRAAEVIASRSPLSVCIALEAVRRAAKLPDVGAVLDQDRTLGRTVCQDPDDFVEGVRAKLVDKDQPRWRHRDLSQVKRAEVLSRFGE